MMLDSKKRQDGTNSSRTVLLFRHVLVVLGVRVYLQIFGNIEINYHIRMYTCTYIRVTVCM